MSLDRAVWLAWWAGTILVLLSYTGTVGRVVGWIGFTLAGIAVLVSVIVRRYWKIPPKGPDEKPAPGSRQDKGS